MAIKFVCDRCGYEMNPLENRTKVTVTNDMGKMMEFDLCISCAYKMNKFLNEKDTVKNEV